MTPTSLSTLSSSTFVVSKIEIVLVTHIVKKLVDCTMKHMERVIFDVEDKVPDICHHSEKTMAAVEALKSTSHDGRSTSHEEEGETNNRPVGIHELVLDSHLDHVAVHVLYPHICRPLLLLFAFELVCPCKFPEWGCEPVE